MDYSANENRAEQQKTEDYIQGEFQQATVVLFALLNEIFEHRSQHR